MNRIRSALFAASVFFAAGSASAAPQLNFDIDGPGSSASATISSSFCIGCTVAATLSPGLGGQVFSLAAGESHSFDFFALTVGGFIGAATVTVLATLAFDEPDAAPATGTGLGGFVTLRGVLSAGSLTWAAPAPITLGNGSVFTVGFSDIAAFGFGNSATVKATITATEVAVPEPASIALLGAGLLGLGMVGRSRRKGA